MSLLQIPTIFQDDGELGTPGNKRKHITLTIEQKLEIIDLVEEGRSSRQMIAQRYGIGKTTVHDIHRQREKIRTFANSQNMNMKRRRVDQKLYKDDLNLKSAYKTVVHIDTCGEETADFIEEIEYQEEFQEQEEFEVVYDDLPNGAEEIFELKPSPASAKRKSKTLTFREKYEIIQQVEDGTSIPLLCQAYGIGRTTVYDYMKRKSEIIDFVEKTDDAQRKTFKRSKYPEIEEQLIEWCESRDTFMRAEFYEAAKGYFENAQASGDVKSGFCGSWSWGKRFFHRHPQLKRKLVNAEGEPIDPAELIVSMVDGVEIESDYRIKCYIPKTAPQKKQVVILSAPERLQLLDDFDRGVNVAEIGEKFNVSKTTVYSIISKRDGNKDQKENKMPRYPKLEAELLAWCLEQKRFPLPLVAITDMARCLFDDMALPGTFTASNTWAKQFITRNPELLKKQNGNYDPQNQLAEKNDLLVEDTDYELDELTDDYIVEELDPNDDEDEQEIDLQEYEEHKLQTSMIKIEPVDAITDDTARSCLETLLKYYEQQGSDDIWTNLKGYHDQLSYDSS